MPVELNEKLTKDTVLARIPAFSPGILRVIDLLSKPDGSAAMLAEAIAVDPSLSAQVMRLANSALFGAQSRIDTVRKAVVVVGHSWIQHLTLTLGVSSYRKAAGQTEELDRCWLHMLASAVLSRELARVVGIPADRAYAAGLLHDIGRLGLLAAFPTECAQALEDAVRDGVAMVDQERAAFGTDHAELGRCLVESWGLPPEFGPVVGHHHQPPENSEMGLQKVVQLACRLADSLGFFFSPPLTPMTLEQVRQTLPAFARQRFPSDAEKLTKMVEESMQEPDSAPAEHSTTELLDPVEAPVAEQSAPVPQIQPSHNRQWIGVVAVLLLLAAALRWLW